MSAPATPPTPPKPAGRRRFWVTVLCFTVANAGAWVLWHRAFGPHARPLLRVDRFDPGDGAVVGPRSELTWRFNLDVGQPGAEVEGAAPAAVTPAVAGRWRWADARTLLFVPTRDLPRATRLRFALSPRQLRTPDGFVLGQSFETTVLTTPLRVLGVRQAAFEEGNRYVLELEFNDRVLPADLVASLGVTTPDGRHVKCHALGQAADRVVRVTTESVVPASGQGGNAGNAQPPDHVNVTLAPGLAGQGGPVGIEDPFVTSLHLEKGLAATGLSANYPARGKPALALRFNGAVDLEALKQVISVEPAVDYALEMQYDGVALRGDFQAGARYAVKIAKPPAGAEKGKFPREGILSALVPDRSAGVWFEHDEGYLGSQGNRTLLAHAVNVPELRVRVYRVYDNNLVAWRNQGNRYSWRQTEAFSQPIATKVLKGAPVKNKEQDLRLSLDELLPASAPRDGVYRVHLAENRKGESGSAGDGADEDDSGDWSEHSGGYGRYGRGYELYGSTSASAVVTLSDIALTAKLARDTVTIWAVSLKSAAPLGKVRARVYSDKNQLLGEAVTNARGLATIINIHPAPGERPSVVLAEKPGAAAKQGQQDESGGEGIAAAARTTLDSARGAGGTWLDLRTSGWETGDLDLSGRPYLRQGCEAFVYSDRGVYRPGETVYLRAIVRGRGGEMPGAFPVRWVIRRPDSHDYRKQVVMLDGDGSAGFALPLPPDLPTGYWSASVGLPQEGESTSRSTGGPREFGNLTFQVEEFIPDRMKVSVRLGDGNRDKDQKDDPPARFAIGDKPLVAAVRADYLFGKPAAGLEARLTARIDPQPFSPRGWEGWTFGDSARLIDGTSAKSTGAVAPKKHRGARAGPDQDDPEDAANLVLDARGHAAWQMNLREMLHLGVVGADEQQGGSTRDRYLGPWSVSVSASVQEAGGRAVTVARQIEADVLPDYLAVRAKGGGAARPGRPAPFELARVQPDGKPAAREGAVVAALLRESWNTTLIQKDGRYHYQSTRVLEPVQDQKELTVHLPGGRGTLHVTVPTSGAYVLRLKDRQTSALTSLSFYASDGTPWDDSVTREHPERLEVVLLPEETSGKPDAKPDAKQGDVGSGEQSSAAPAAKGPGFRTGQSARALVRSPFAGTLLLAVETDGVVWTRVVEMTASQVVVPVPVTDACRPNAFVTATVVRAIDPDARWRTHRAFGAARLRVDPAERKLDMTLTAAGEVRPRQPLEVGVKVLDSSGNPVPNTAVTLAAVDEGILQLTSFPTPNPLGYFESRRALAVRSADVYSQLMPEVARPDRASAPGGDADGPAGRHSTPVHARRVNSVSLVTQVLHTDEQGVARTSLAVPEFVGKLRLMAVGYASDRFGAAEQSVLVRSPLLVQSSFPRFAAPGDRFEVPLVAFNNGTADGDAKVTVEVVGDGPLAIEGPGGQPPGKLELAPVHLSAGGQAALSFSMLARRAAGVAKVRVSATLGNESFEENLELPVRPASPAIARGGYASASPREPLKLSVPGGLLPGTEALDVKVTPWPGLRLPDGLDYLERYPYGCAEQTISTCFPLAYLSDIGRQIAPGVFEPRRVEDKVQAGLYRLIGMQTADGGIAMWPGSAETWPWASIYAAHFVIEAEKAGHPVPEDFRRRLLAYARRLLARSGDDADLVEEQAYACYVLALAGKPERSSMNRLTELTEHREQTALTGTPAGEATTAESRMDWLAQRQSARLWLSLAWLSAGRRDLADHLLPQAPPLPRQGRQSGGNVGSPVRDRALAVRTMLEVRPDDPALPALVQQLADAGRDGNWRSTQDTAFAVMAIGRYLRQAKPAEPYRQAQLWLGDEQLESADGGKSIAFRTDANAVRLKPPAGIAGREFQVRISGPAAAKAHIAWVQSGVPLTPPGDQDQGMKVRRRYLDESGKPLGNQPLVSGHLVRVELAVEAPAGTDNLVIEDLLPAGLEVENPRLDTSAAGASPVPANRRGRVARGPVHQDPSSDSASTPFGIARLDVRDDRLVLVGMMPQNAPAGVAKYTYLARAVAPGTFVVPPVRGECMYDTAVNSLSGGGATLVVAPVAPAGHPREEGAFHPAASQVSSLQAGYGRNGW